MKILFSPVGSTDPISDFHDGALLHIIRFYKPEKVILYMSKEINELEEKDHRYSYCLDNLKKLMDIDFDIEYYTKPELVNVHIFDYFIDEFRKILNDLNNKYEDSDLLLNVSSGTPAMKSALQILSAYYDKPMKPIQVSTPRKAINKREDVKGEYSVELQWELNEDNCENIANVENRCSESVVLNMSLEIKKKLIKKEIDAKDYVSALRIMEPIYEYLPENSIKLVKAGAARLKLDKSTCSRLSNETGYKIYPVQNSSQIDIFEYFMLLSVKLEKEEYADFIRAISPIFSILMETIIKNSADINLEEYLYEIKAANKTTIKKWNASKIVMDSAFSGIRAESGFDPVVNTRDYCTIIQNLNFDNNLKELITKIRDTEKTIRNPVAHTITHVTEEVIKKATGLTPMTILKDIRKLCSYAGINIKDEYLRTYDDLNNEIKKYLL
ncbi:MAG: CRISPR-associated protein Csm6 [Eubacteriales bacterium]|nr:CRISPR-associated protein Csm6 [Eubacteriales bacterium]